MSSLSSNKFITPQASKLIQNCMKASNIGPNAVQAQQNASSVTPMFAVVAVGPTQYKVSQGDTIATPLFRATIGSKICLKKVLLVGGAKFTAIGRPLLENVRVICDVEENKMMRATPHVSRPRGRRLVFWKDMPAYCSILRVRSIEYEPVVVGELDKYNGNLIDPNNSVAGEALNTSTMNYENMPVENLDEFQSEAAEFFKQFAPSKTQQQPRK